MIRDKLIPLIIGFVFAAGISYATRPEPNTEVKTVASVQRYQVKSEWANWTGNSLVVGDDRGLSTYFIVRADDGTVIRVEGTEYPVNAGDEYRGEWVKP